MTSLPLVLYLIGAVSTASSLSVERSDWPTHRVLAAWLLLVALWPALWIAALIDLANKDTNHDR